ESRHTVPGCWDERAEWWSGKWQRTGCAYTTPRRVRCSGCETRVRFGETQRMYGEVVELVVTVPAAQARDVVDGVLNGRNFITIWTGDEALAECGQRRLVQPLNVRPYLRVTVAVTASEDGAGATVRFRHDSHTVWVSLRAARTTKFFDAVADELCF